MQQTIQNSAVPTVFRSVGADTAVVLFLLALEYGRSITIFSIEGAITGLTLGMILVLPFGLPARHADARFSTWFMVRSVILVFGLAAGSAFRVGTAASGAPEAHWPMTLLIFASIASCLYQYYGLLRLRPAK